MRIDLPQCGLKTCHYYSDGNCVVKTKYEECDYAYVSKLLYEYENTGLTPQEIEQMKARMPLRYWTGESPEKMSIFGVSVSKIIELVKVEKDGGLLKLPCRKGYIKHGGHMDEVELYSIDLSGYEIVYTYYGVCELDNLPFMIDIKEKEIENKLLLNGE